MWISQEDGFVAWANYNLRVIQALELISPEAGEALREKGDSLGWSERILGEWKYASDPVKVARAIRKLWLKIDQTKREVSPCNTTHCSPR